MSNNSQNQTAASRENSVSQAMVLRRQLLQCMAENLTPRQYQVCVLSCLEGMPQTEIAYELGLSRSMVSRHLRGGKERLRAVMGDAYADCTPTETNLTIFPAEPHAVQLPGWIAQSA